MQRQMLLNIGQNLGNVLRVLGDTAQFLLIEVGRDLFAQQYLTDNTAQIRRPRTVVCRRYTINGGYGVVKCIINRTPNVLSVP